MTFNVIEKYVEMSPMDFRVKMKEHTDITDIMDGYVDKCYELNQRIQFYTKMMQLKQFELKASIFGGLTKEDIELYDKTKKEAKYEPKP